MAKFSDEKSSAKKSSHIKSGTDSTISSSAANSTNSDTAKIFDELIESAKEKGSNSSKSKTVVSPNLDVDMAKTGTDKDSLAVEDKPARISKDKNSNKSTGKAAKDDLGKSNNSTDTNTEEDAGTNKTQVPPKKRRLKLILLIGGGVLLAIIVAVVFAILLWKSDIDTKISLDTTYDTETVQKLNKTLTKPASPEEPYYILILGSDSRDESNMGAGRADTQILVRVDPANPQVSLLSIPRDTKVELEGYGTAKINAAYELDGPAGAVDAVKKLCGIEIAHYVEIDFNGLISLVDKLGGVEVNVPVDLYYKGESLTAGTQVLNGSQALLMSRSRNFVDGDFQRMKNQRILMQAIAKKVLASSPTDMPSLVSDLASCVKTDISSTDALDLLLKLRGLDTKTKLFMTAVPSHSQNIDSVSYVVIEEEAFATTLEKFKAGEKVE